MLPRSVEFCSACGCSGRLAPCSACGSAAYCGRQCQKSHWPNHKPTCRATGDAISQTLDKWLLPPQREAYDQELVDALGRGQAHVRDIVASGWTIRVTKSRLLKNSNMDSRDETHIGWKRDLSLTLHAGQELPEAVFGDSHLQLSHTVSGLRLSFCALDALRCWALLDLPAVPHYHEWQQQQRQQLDHHHQHQSSQRPSPGGIDVELLHSWDYTFTTTYAGSTDMGPLGWGLPAHPAPHCCDSLYARPAVDLAKGKAKLRKAMCSCTNGRAPFISLPTVAVSGKGAQDDGGAAAVARTAATEPQTAGAVPTPVSESVGRQAREQSPTSLPPPPSWSIDYSTKPKTAARHTDLPALLRLDASSSRARSIDPASWSAEGWARELVIDTVHLWLDNLDPHSLSFLRASIVVAETFWFVQLRCFTRVNGVMARVLDTKLSCRLGDDSGIVHRERTWREGTWAQLCAGMTAGQSNHNSTNGTCSTVPPAPPRCVDFGGLCDRLAYERLSLRHPAIFDRLALKIPRPPSPQEPSGCTGSGAAAAVSSKAWRCTSQVMWERQLRCEALCGVPAGRRVGCVSGAVLMVDCDGARVGVLYLLDAETEEGAVSQWKWRRSLTDDSSLILSTAITSQRSNQYVDDQTSNISCTSLLALGDDRGWVHILDLDTGVLLANIAVAVPRPCIDKDDSGDGTSVSAVSSSPSSSSTLTWVEKLCWSSDGQWLGAGAGRTVVIASIQQEEESVDTARGCLRAEVVRTLKNSKQFGTVSDVAFGSFTLTNEPNVGAAESPVKTLQKTDSCGEFAFGGYGGVKWLGHQDQEKYSSSPPVLEIGATATLAVATSPDSRFVAVGCLDKRMRIFERTASKEKSPDPYDYDVSLAQTDANTECHSVKYREKQAQTLPAWDWVGFDGPVASVAWSTTGKWLAAAGGTALLVVPKEQLLPSRAAGNRAEPPIRCIVPGGMARGGVASSFGEITWCSSGGSLSDRGAVESHESLLAAIVCPTGLVYLYSVAAECLDGGVPRHAAPLLSLPPPGTGAGVLHQCSSVAHIAFVPTCTDDGLDSSHRQEVFLVAAHGEWSVAVRVELQT